LRPFQWERFRGDSPAVVARETTREKTRIRRSICYIRQTFASQDVSPFSAIFWRLISNDARVKTFDANSNAIDRIKSGDRLDRAD